MRCIAIDDEKLGLDLICSYIKKVPFLEMGGAFTSPAEALKFLMNNPVELVFSDIELHGTLNGIQLIASLPARPLVIFTTAYDNYAVDSYSLDAVDYILKPVSPERFFRAANKAYEIWSRSKSSEKTTDEMQSVVCAPDFLFFKTENRLLKIFLADILFIEGYGDYIKIHLADKRTVLSLQSMNSLEAKLSDNFIRTHRSYIVALDKIDEIERRRIKIGKDIIPISESYQRGFFARLHA